MLRLIRKIAISGTLLLAGVAWAQNSTPVKDDPVKAADTTIPDKEPTPTPPVAPVTVEPEATTTSPIDPVKIAKRARYVGAIGLDTQGVTVGGIGSETTSSAKDWGFKFKGFFRGPMRLGIDGSGTLTPGKLQLHAPPVTPDSNYIGWTYTNLNPGPWAELLFQYGTQTVMMTTSIASYNITTGGWRELQDQLGIDRAFLTLKFPEALGAIGGMVWDVGIFSNFYGAMGKYNAGQYETYLIGRTNLAGATATADISLNNDLTLIIEAGAGAKTDQQYQTYQYDNSLKKYVPTVDYPSWQPYSGDKVQVGTTVLAHAHAGIIVRGMLTGTIHYINTFVRDARWNVGSTGGLPAGTNPEEKFGEGSIQVAGADLRLDSEWLGEGYLGYSMVKSHNAYTVANSIELLHSQGGWQLARNFFPDDGNGTIHSISFQYTFSVAAFARHPIPFDGQSADLTIRPFLMYNKVTNTVSGRYDMSKLKYGIDAIYSFMPIMAIGLRADVVNPKMSDSHRTFYILAPRLIFRSEFLTREMVILQYSRYFYNSAYTDPSTAAGVMPWPYGTGGTLDTSKLGYTPDKDVISLSACMWW
jgi:hypothetical protein